MLGNMAARLADDVGVGCDEDEGIKPAAKLFKNMERGTELLTMVRKKL